jgi:hypothetical protein
MSCSDYRDAQYITSHHIVLVDSEILAYLSREPCYYCKNMAGMSEYVCAAHSLHHFRNSFCTQIKDRKTHVQNLMQMFFVHPSRPL